MAIRMSPTCLISSLDKGILQHVGENHAHNIRFLYKNEDDASRSQVSTEPMRITN